MTKLQHVLAKVRDEPLFGALGLIVSAERLIDAQTSPHVHKGIVSLIEAVRAELAKASASDCDAKA